MPQVDIMKTYRAIPGFNHPLPRSVDLRRANCVIGALWRLGNFERSRPRQGLGTLLATGDPGLRACVSRCQRRRLDCLTGPVSGGNV